MKRALLLGGTGAVGGGCLDVLARRGDISLLIGGRDEARLREEVSAIPADVETVPLDATDAAAVAAAVARCDVVINCAGPSQQLSARVAGVAIAAGVPYVDPGGDHALLDRLAAAAPAVPVVLQAGVQPGLSGLLLRALALRRTHKIELVTAWCGGLQRLTPASVLEYVGSLHDTHSHPGAALRDGVIQRAGHAECAPAPAQYFPDSVMARPCLDAETVSVAAHLGIENVSWMNVFDGAHTTRAIQLLAAARERGAADPGSVLTAARLDLFGRRPYFAIVASAYGAGRTSTVAFTCPDSYRVTGALAAFAARHVVDMPAGVRPFWSVAEPRRALEFVTETVSGSQVSFADDAAARVVSALMIDEGSL